MKRVDRIDVQHLNAVLDDRFRGVARMSTPQAVLATVEPFIVNHDLVGASPDEIEMCFMQTDQPEIIFTIGFGIATTVYATDADRATWTSSAATLRATQQANVRIWFVTKGK